MARSLFLLLLLSACVSVNKSVLDRTFEARPVAGDDVYVFLSADEVPETCTRVAILHASAATGWSNEGKIIDKLRSETGKLGGNAILLQSMEEAGAGEQIVGGLLGTGSDTDSDAIALHCPDEAMLEYRTQEAIDNPTPYVEPKGDR